MERIFAVLVDAENIKANDFMRVLAEVESYGNAAIKWVYADWTNPMNKSWLTVLESSAARAKQQFHYTKKDDADHSLIMDTIEIMNNNERINSICLVTSDGGFASLAQRVREYGLYCMVIGEDKTPAKLIKACSNFVDIKNTKSIDKNNGENRSLIDLLIDAYKRCSSMSDDEDVYLGDLGTMLKRIDSSFDYRKFGATSLKKLLKSNYETFEISQESNDRCYIKLKLSQYSGKIDKLIKRDGYAFAESGGKRYFLHRSEFNTQTDWQRITQGSKVKFQVHDSLESNNESPRGKNIAIC